jgi:two-component system OmpR family response regulator
LGETKTGTQAEGPVVLVVEDDREVAALVAQCLEESGYRTVWAKDGEGALREVGRQRVSLVLLDWRLPGDLLGGALVRRLRAACPYRLPVVVISGDPASLTEASKYGVQDYLPKPFQLADLVHVVDEHSQ